jgi:hypothetical protein
MLVIDDLGVEDARSVALELGTYKGDVPGRIEETIRRAVKGHESAAVFDVPEQGVFLIGRNGLGVGIDQERVVVRKRLSIQILDVLGIRQLDATAGEDGLQLGRAIGWAVMTSVTEEENVEFRRRSFGIGHLGILGSEDEFRQTQAE